MSNGTYIVPPGSAHRPSASARSAAFLNYVSADVEAVEACLNEELGSDVRTVYDLSRYILNAGGKRLRPAMVALSARAVQPDIASKAIAPVGAAVELVHMATLIHDDVVDDTATRRGKPTANAVFGNGVAVLSGDYILARSVRLLAVNGDMEILRTVAEITIEMSEGEVLEIAATGRADLPLEEYLEILRKKTATFVEGCCRCGAMLANADERLERALAEYGYRLGMAFQIADDLLDYTGDPTITGKPCGSDLRDGRATLPFQLALGAATASESRALLAAFGNPDLDTDGFHRVYEIMAKYDVFERTRSLARDHVEKAAESLCLLPPSTARDCFELLTDYVVQRDR